MLARQPESFLFSDKPMVEAEPGARLRWQMVASCLAGLVLMNSASLAAVRSTQKRTTHHSASNSPAARSRHHLPYTGFYPLFPGSHDLLVEQNAELDRQQIPRMT